MDFVWFMICYLIFFALSIPIHELGHLVCGLLSGYSFSSFRILSFVWLKENGRLTFRLSKGFLIGQCIMSPAKDESKFRFVLYNLGGGLANLAVALILFVLAICFWGNEYLQAFFVAGCAVNIVMGLTNLIPMNFNIPNDGMNIFMGCRSKEAKHGFFLMLYINNETVEGKRYRDFDPNLFLVNDSADFNNYFVACIVIYEATRLYDLGDYEKCIEQYSRLNLDKLQSYYKNSIYMDILYYYIVHNPDYEKAKEIYNKKQMKALFKLNIPMFTHVLSAYEYFVNNDKEAGRKLLLKAKKGIENYPNKGIASMEKDYISELEKLF